MLNKVLIIRFNYYFNNCNNNGCNNNGQMNKLLHFYNNY